MGANANNLAASGAVPVGADGRVIEESPDCIKVLDLDGRLLSMNAGGMRALEICDLARFIGTSWIDFWEGDDRSAAAQAVAVARGGGVGRFTGFFATTQSRQARWWDVIVSPILDGNGKPEKLIASSRDVTQWKRTEHLLQAILEGTAAVTGKPFFSSLVRHLAAGVGVRYSFVAECLPDLRARSLAFWRNDGLGPDFEYDLRGTPCWNVVEGRTCQYDRGLQQLFPDDVALAEMKAESYLGVPLRDATQRVIGHLVIMDDKPLDKDPLLLSVLETFANRAGAEIDRMRAFDSLHRRNQESEERYRDLFDEAPIAYVHEGLDTRFIRANRAAMRTLGITPDQVMGTYGRTFVPDTEDAQRRLAEAIESVNRGSDASGILLELRRRDNGKPIWIQWWSKPDPSGTYTRTMFIDVTERVLMEQANARLRAQNAYLQEEIRSTHNFGEIIGSHPALLDVLRQVDTVAPTDSTVLIVGETGTGKELIARAIHDRSTRRGGPLVAVNCGAISSGLVESELFGHLKGAFTGAVTNRDGRFKVADGGTIFLDEIGELPLETQVKLLRVLQEQEFEPIGSSRPIKVNVRVIAATNRDLAAAVDEGRFRRDLYYRLNVFPLVLPPLRDRLSDIAPLTAFFAAKFAKKLGHSVKHVPDETLRRLQAYSWPGNIRELQNVIERAILLSPDDTLVVSPVFGPAPRMQPPQPDAPARADDSATLPIRASAPAARDDSGTSLEDVERRHIESILRQTNWLIEGERGAALLLNLNPSTLRSRMKKLGIQRPS